MPKTILRGGKIYDGTAADSFIGDILFEGDKILRVSREIIDDADAEVVDITGKSISSGFFDAHSHNDWFAIKKQPLKYFEPFIRQGFTSFVAGNCGLSAMGFKPDTRHVDKIGGGLFGYGNGDCTGVYPTVREFFDAIDRNTPCNIATLVGHCSARAGVAGYSGEPLTDGQMREMLASMEQGLKDGACGLSLGLMYRPGQFAPLGELREVAKLCEKYDRPMTVHPRAESRVGMDYPLIGRAHILRALDELVEVCKGLKMKFEYSHAIFVGRKSFKYKEEVHRIISDMRKDGIDAGFDIYNECLGVSVITVIMPAWYSAMSAKDKRKPWNKLRFAFLCYASIALLGFGFNDIVIAYLGPGYEKYEGKTVHQIARELGMRDVDAYLTLCEWSNFNGRVNMGPYSTPEIISWQSKRDDVLYMTDAWVEEHGIQNPAIYDCHPKFLRDSLLGRGDTMPRTIRKMTGAVADRFTISGRGYVKEGYAADFTVFDEEALRNGTPDRSEAFGIDQVWINGTRVLCDGRIDAEALKTTGRALRSRP